jgi:hypothetical protein
MVRQPPTTTFLLAEFRESKVVNILHKFLMEQPLSLLLGQPTLSTPRQDDFGLSSSSLLGQVF